MILNRVKKVLAAILTAAMVVGLSAAAGVPVRAFAEEKDGEGKYISDVFIAYAKTEEEAKKWLVKNGWEPIDGDFNAGKASYWDDSVGHRDNVAAVMGIKRTDDDKNAITDMAVMNMEGGYSLPDYKELLDQKKGQINEFVNSFLVTVQEFRANYNNEGSKFGKERADLAYEVLNKFYDGDPEDPVAVNDTGEKLGDLFKEATRQEGNEKGVDLEQLILEASGPAVTAVEVLLALGSDPGQESWIERAGGLTGDELAENLPKYVPEAAGQDVAPSAIPQYLGQTYGDTAKILCDQWTDINDAMIWLEKYNDENGLWQGEDESDEDYIARVDQFFDDMKKTDEEKWSQEADLYAARAILYESLYEWKYEGEWGETLGDFFNPADDTAFAFNSDNYLAMAAALSNGQRASLDFLSLNALLMIGFSDSKGLKYVLPDIEEFFVDEMEAIDIYIGVKRAAFRTGVAMTSEALMDQKAGKGQAFDQIWDNTGIVAITTYASAAVGLAMMIAGGVMMVKGKTVVQAIAPQAADAVNTHMAQANNLLAQLRANGSTGSTIDAVSQNYRGLNNVVQNRVGSAQTATTRMGYAGRVFLGVGGALLIGAAVVSAIRLWKYYDRDMKPIPRMIVDESDIVTYLFDKDGKPILDENGNQKKNIDFNTFEYYDAVKCNRPEVGEIGDWNDGVSEYKNQEHYCYDIADLNADMGQEWLALYTVKSKNKGNPILADTILLKYGKENNIPERCTTGLHLFNYSSIVDLGDTAWAYNNKKKGVRLYWGEDPEASAPVTAASFTRGQLAMAGLIGLLIGALGTTFALRPRRKEEEEPAA